MKDHRVDYVHRNADYLSSIELLIIDQMDALTMQNWEHIKVELSISFSSLLKIVLVCSRSSE
jgi:hypothetical protein